ncbi:MAG: cobalamin B12-binding domain-containing protein [Elusimicrobia bacterium]|nr:cobalamin B12-binding domain-containing protein [Elusimicrobiota bacterium]
MRILLVKPDARLETVRRIQRLLRFEPLELGYLAAALAPGHEARVLDLRLWRRPDKEFGRALRDWRPDVVGISAFTHEAARAKELARMVRADLPRCVIVVGGHHATMLPKDFDLDCFDAVVRGDGCGPLAAIVEAAAAGKGLDGLENVLVPGGRFDTAGLPLYPDPGSLPRPRRDLWETGAYRSAWWAGRLAPGETAFPRVALVRSSYGCRMSCSFCAVPRLCGGRHRARPARDVAAEIAGLSQSHVAFCDDETFIDGRTAEELAEALLARGVEKRYFGWARSTTVNGSPGLFKLWRRAGLDGVFIGFESPTDADLRAVSKRATVADNERAHETLSALGITVQAAFIVRPEVGHDDLRRLRRYVEAMPPCQASFSVLTPFPGSPAWERSKDRFIGDPVKLHDWLHPLTPTTLPLREFFAEFASLVALGGGMNPLNADPGLSRRTRWRMGTAMGEYCRSLRNAHRDYP